MRRAVEVVFRTEEVGFGLGDLRFGLRFRGVGGEEFAFQIAEIALRLLEVGPLPGPGRGECVNCSTRFFARSIRGVSDGLLGLRRY